MQLIAKVLVCAFFLQYYLTLALSIGLNLLRKVLAWVVGGKDVPKIHPFHNAHEEVFSWKEDFVRVEGYTLEDHRFGTEDGAEVHLWRIRRELSPPDKPYPVVIMHGLLESASTWFLAAQKSKCLPYLLAAEGYDVWVGNNRGNRISQTPGHYQNYTIDDLVHFDQPTIIQGVLQKTDKKKIIYVGHSQGSTQFLLALGVHEELKEKVAAFVGMGSIVSLSSLVDNVPLNYLSRLYIIQLLQLLGFSKVLLFSRWMSQAIGVLIYNSSFHMRLITRGIKHLIGRNNDLIPPSMVGLIFTHEPGGGSLNNILHWMQCFRSRKTFSKFCFGKRRNLQVYGMERPPEYCLQHLKTLPFASLLFRGEKDGLASHEDFMELVGRFDEESVSSVELKEYNHLDYLWSEKAPLDIYQRILAFANDNSLPRQTVQTLP